MIRALALLLLLGAPFRDHAWVPFHEALRQAEVVLTGDLVEVGKGEAGRKSALFRVDTVLKGEFRNKTVVLRVWEMNPRIGCPPPSLDLVKDKRYLLYLMLQPEAREIHPQFSHPGSGDDAGDGSQVKLARVILDLLAGKNTEARVQDLGSFIDSPHHSRLAYEAVDLLTRRQARPILGPARKYFSEYCRHWPSPLPAAGYARESYLHEILTNSQRTLDFKIVGQVRGEQSMSIAFLPAASRVCGRKFATLAEFDAWWSSTQKRARAASPQAGEQADRFVKDLRSPDLRTRNRAVEQLLDLGPQALPAVLPLTQDRDAEVRSAAAALEEELRLLIDFADDLAR